MFRYHAKKTLLHTFSPIVKLLLMLFINIVSAYLSLRLQIVLLFFLLACALVGKISLATYKNVILFFVFFASFIFATRYFFSENFSLENDFSFALKTSASLALAVFSASIFFETTSQFDLQFSFARALQIFFKNKKNVLLNVFAFASFFSFFPAIEKTSKEVSFAMQNRIGKRKSHRFFAFTIFLSVVLVKLFSFTIDKERAFRNRMN